jgi:hypothetical protein
MAPPLSLAAACNRRLGNTPDLLKARWWGIIRAPQGARGGWQHGSAAMTPTSRPAGLEECHWGQPRCRAGCQDRASDCQDFSSPVCRHGGHLRLSGNLEAGDLVFRSHSTVMRRDTLLALKRLLPGASEWAPSNRQLSPEIGGERSVCFGAGDELK